MNLLDYILNEINRTDFFNILEQKDKGSNFFYCPFHKEKTPSLYLYDSSLLSSQPISGIAW